MRIYVQAFCTVTAGILIFHRVKRRVRRKRPRDIEPHCWSQVTTRDQFSFPSGPPPCLLTFRRCGRTLRRTQVAGVRIGGVPRPWRASPVMLTFLRECYFWAISSDSRTPAC